MPRRKVYDTDCNEDWTYIQDLFDGAALALEERQGVSWQEIRLKRMGYAIGRDEYNQPILVREGEQDDE